MYFPEIMVCTAACVSTVQQMYMPAWWQVESNVLPACMPVPASSCAYLPALVLFQLKVLTSLSQELLHLEHISSAGICTGFQGDLSVLGDTLIYCLGHLRSYLQQLMLSSSANR